MLQLFSFAAMCRQRYGPSRLPFATSSRRDHDRAGSGILSPEYTGYFVGSARGLPGCLVTSRGGSISRCWYEAAFVPSSGPIPRSSSVAPYIYRLVRHAPCMELRWRRGSSSPDKAAKGMRRASSDYGKETMAADLVADRQVTGEAPPPTRRALARFFAGRLQQGVAGVFALKVVYSGLLFLTGVLLTRSLGPSAYGAYAYALTWATTLAAFALCGLDRVLLRKVAVHQVKREWGLLRGLCGRPTRPASWFRWRSPRRRRCCCLASYRPSRTQQCGQRSGWDWLLSR